MGVQRLRDILKISKVSPTVKICPFMRWWAVQPLDWRRWRLVISSYVLLCIVGKMRWISLYGGYFFNLCDKTPAFLRHIAYFVKSILWLCKPRIHCKINTKLTVAHWTTSEYEFRGLGDNLFWISPLTQYHALNFLIVQSGLLLHLKDHIVGGFCIKWGEIMRVPSRLALPLPSYV